MYRVCASGTSPSSPVRCMRWPILRRRWSWVTASVSPVWASCPGWRRDSASKPSCSQVNTSHPHCPASPSTSVPLSWVSDWRFNGFKGLHRVLDGGGGDENELAVFLRRNVDPGVQCTGSAWRLCRVERRGTLCHLHGLPSPHLYHLETAWEQDQAVL